MEIPEETLRSCAVDSLEAQLGRHSENGGAQETGRCYWVTRNAASRRILFWLGIVSFFLLICPCSRAQGTQSCLLSGYVNRAFSVNLATACTGAAATSCAFGPGSLPVAPGIGTLGGCTISGNPTKAGLYIGNVFDIGGASFNVNFLILDPVVMQVAAQQQYMIAQFTAPDITNDVDSSQSIQNPTLLQLAQAAGFASFDWQQIMTVLPVGNPLKASIVPNDPSLLPQNVYPPNCSSVAPGDWLLSGCSLVAGDASLTGDVFSYPSFNDPPPGGYTYLGTGYNPYPFGYPPYPSDWFVNGGYCTVAEAIAQDVNIGECPPFPYVVSLDGATLSMVDAPTDYSLPGDAPSAQPNPGHFLGFSTSLVGLYSNNNPAQPLYSWTWNSTFNGFAWSGVAIVSQSAGLYPIDPNSGTGGVTVTSKNGIPTPSVIVTPTESSIDTSEPLPVTVVVSGGNGNPTPTGSVTLTSAGYISVSTSLTGGAATINIPARSLLSGNDILIAVYTPDSSSSTTYSDSSGFASVSVTTPGATSPTVTVTPSSPSITTAQALTVTVAVSGGAGSSAATGSVVLTSGSYTSPVTTLTGGSVVISIPAGALELGEDTLTATYTPDASGAPNYNSASGSASVSVNLPVLITPTVTVTPSSSTVAMAQALTVTVAVSGGTSNPTPTGSATLTSGSYTSASMPLSAGSTTITIPAGSLATGTDTLTVNYVPDAQGSAIYTSTAGSAPVFVTGPTVYSPCQTASGSGIQPSETWIGNGPCGGYIGVLVVDPTTPTTIYAGTSGAGVFKSTNGGGNWTAINNGLSAVNVNNGSSGVNVYALAIDPATSTTLYVVAGGGLFRSTDAGGSWDAVSAGGPASPINALAIAPTTPTTLYLGTYSGGVLKSTDGGMSWTASNSGLPTGIVDTFPCGTSCQVVNSLVVDPVTPTTLYAVACLLGSSGEINNTNGYGLFKSIDGGGSWTAESAGLPATTATYIFDVVIDPVTPTTLYATVAPISGGGLGVFKSTDGGASWGAVNTGFPDLAIWSVAIDPASPSTLYAGDASATGLFYKSTNGGGNWSAVTSPDGQFINEFAFVRNPTNPSTIYAGGSGNGGGVFKSIDGGASWTAVNTGLSATSVTSVAIDPTTPTTIYATTNDGSGGVFKSTDGGGSWTIANTGIPNSYPYSANSLVIDPSDPTTLYVGGNGCPFAGLYESTNGGGTWSAANAGLPCGAVVGLAIDPATPTTLYAGTFNGLFKSTDGGGSWNAINNGLAANGTAPIVGALAIDPVTPTTIYAGGSGSSPYDLGNTNFPGVFKSTDGGADWSAASNGLAANGSTPIVTALAIDPATPTMIYAQTLSSGVFKSTDGGGTWSAVNAGLAGNYLAGFALAIDPKAPAILYAGTYSGVIGSANGGGNWSLDNGDLTVNWVQALGIDSTGSELVAGTSGGVFTTSAGLTLGPTTTTLVSSPNPSGYFQSVTLTATVTSSSGTPTGSVQFMDGQNPIATLQLNAGAASDPISFLARGSHAITATYQPDSISFAASTSKVVTQVVTTEPTVSVTPSAFSITTSQQLTVTVAVSGGSGNPTPTGSVTLTNGTYTSAPTTLSSGGSTTINVPAGSLAVGYDTLTASYAPDSNSSSIYSSASGTNLVAVNALTPTVTVTPGSGSITTLQLLQVTVMVNGGSGNPTPTGSVTLTSGSYTSAATALSSDSATITVPAGALSAGSDALTATYTPDSSSSSTYQSATGSSGSVTVSKATPTIAATPGSSSITTTQPLQVTVTMSGGSGNPAPTGTVTLTSGKYTSAATSLSGGSATITIPAESLAVGNDTLSVSYSGDPIYSVISGTGSVTVTLSTASVTVTPANSGTFLSSKPESVTIAVAGSGPAPTGTITLTGGGYTSASTPLSSGSANITIPANQFTTAGSITLTANYTGDGVYASGSGTGSVTVNAPYSLATTTPSAINPGSDATATITLTADPSYSGTVTLACTLATSPTGAQDLPGCSVTSGSPVTVTNGTASGSTSVTITTTAYTASLDRRGLPGWTGARGGMVFALLVFLGIPARRRSWRNLLGLIVVMATFGTFAACGSGGGGGGGGGGGNPGTTAGNYTFTVTGTGTPGVSPAPTATVKLTVN